jgi:hypothetical protein
VPTGNFEPEAGLQFTWTLPSTMSEALGGDQFSTFPLGSSVVSLMLSGTPLSDGGVVSRTVTVNDPADVPSSSLVQFTVVTPRGNTEPEGGSQVTPSPGL